MKYTLAQTKTLVDGYGEGRTVEALAEELNVPVKSVIAKLANLGVYKKKPYTTKQGTPSIRKSAYIEKIAALLEVEEFQVECLEKVTKPVLELLIKGLEK